MSTTNRHEYDWDKIDKLRSQGVQWRKLALDPTVYQCCPGEFSSLYKAYKKRRKAANDPNFVMDKRFKKKRLSVIIHRSIRRKGYPHMAD